MTEAEPQNTDRPSDGSKVLGDFWDPKLNPYVHFPENVLVSVITTFISLLSPILRVFLSLPLTSSCPMTAPLTHAVHALIAIPISPALKSTWFSTQSNSQSSTPKSSRSEPGSRSHSPSRSSPTSSKPSTLDRALSKLGRKSRSPSPVVTSPTQVLNKALEILDATLAHYFPGKTEADDASVREQVKKEATDSLDELLDPTVVLITRLCAADESCRVRVRQYFVPDDLDRSSPLEERADILGRCLRMLGSVYHSRLKNSIGEMLYAACESNGT